MARLSFLGALMVITATSPLMAGCESIPGISSMFAAPSVTGTWLVSIPDTGGVADLKLFEDDGKLTGTFGASIIQMSLKGTRTVNKVEWTINPPSFGGQSEPLKMTGEVAMDGKKITGQMDNASKSAFVAVKS